MSGPAAAKHVTALRALALAAGVAALVAALLFAMALAMRFFGGTSSSRQALPTVPVQVAPLPPFELNLLHEPSRTIDNADLRGAPFLIAAWASWCGACAKESPVKQRLAASGRIRIVGLNIDHDRASALRWLQRFGDAHTLVLSDPDHVVFDRFGLDFTPEYILVDAEGTVRWRWRGLLIDAVIEQQLLPAIDALAPPQRSAARTGTMNSQLAPARVPAAVAVAQATPEGGG